MDDIVEDSRKEIEVMLGAWRNQGLSGKGLFTPGVGTPYTPRADYGTLA
jgi:putative membrane protein